MEYGAFGAKVKEIRKLTKKVKMKNQVRRWFSGSVVLNLWLVYSIKDSEFHVDVKEGGGDGRSDRNVQ